MSEPTPPTYKTKKWLFYNQAHPQGHQDWYWHSDSGPVMAYKTLGHYRLCD
ncbi:MAG: hypothetical protein Q4P24_15685 [Rhodobacterales bacterium]|nr:hypothetical protein [Rhodobacterales bacterium]